MVRTSSSRTCQFTLYYSTNHLQESQDTLRECVHDTQEKDLNTHKVVLVMIILHSKT